MKTIVTISIVFLIVQTGFGQDTLVIKNTIDKFNIGNTKLEEYTISLPDSVKNGSYKLYSEQDNLLQEGNYLNGNRNGVWKYYGQDNQAELIGKFNWNTLKEEPSSNKGKSWGLINSVIISIISDKTRDHKSSINEKVFLIFILNPNGKLLIDKYGADKMGYFKEGVSIENQVLFDEIVKSFPILQFVPIIDFNTPISLPIQIVKN